MDVRIKPIIETVLFELLNAHHPQAEGGRGAVYQSDRVPTITGASSCSLWPILLLDNFPPEYRPRIFQACIFLYPALTYTL